METLYEKSSLILNPGVYDTGKVYCTKPFDGSGDLTFTRNSNATRVNADGLVEKVRTNLALYSEQFDNVVWNKATLTVTANAGTAPDGTTTADLMYPSANSTNSVLFNGIAVSSGVEYTNSIYVKASGKTWVFVRGINDANGVWFDVANGVKGTTGSGVSGNITSVGSGWYRCSVTQTSSSTTGRLVVLVVDGNASTSVTANGTDGLLIWGAQQEAGVMTDYIPTTSAAVSVGPTANVPRLNYSNGCPSLLLEPQRTNFATYSEDISQAVLGNAVVTKNQTTAPDGYISADSIIDNGNTSSHNLYKYYTSASASGTAVRFSLFAKKDSHDWFQLAGGGATDDQWANFNLATGAIGNSKAGSNPKIEAYSNGWYRVSITLNTTSSSALVAGFISLTNNTNPNARNYSYSGAGGGVFAWGYQLEEASYASSYIGPTLGASVTRLADAAYKTGIASLIGQTEGTLFVDVTTTNDITTVSPITLSDGSGSNRVLIYIFTETFIATVTAGGSTQAFFTSSTISPNTRYKAALAYKANDFAFYINGEQVGTDTSGTVPLCSKLGFDNGSGGTLFQGLNNQALLFKTRLTNAQLAELTAL